ncbi:hypothetical protein Vi05172_g9756 [Venturia inaequalis]|nr:hypothetical protein Vi05172_g9756 [Venturia inaequalis]
MKRGQSETRRLNTSEHLTKPPVAESFWSNVKMKGEWDNDI